MTSAKVIKYLSQYGERNYAPKVRKIEKCDLKQYQNRDACRQATETSCSNSDEQSRKIKEEKVANEKSRTEENLEPHQEGRQGIQDADQGRCEIGQTNQKEGQVDEKRKKTREKRKQSVREEGRKERKKIREEEIDAVQKILCETYHKHIS